MSEQSRYRLEVLNDRHAIHAFACEDEEISEYLHDTALIDMADSVSRTFVEMDAAKPATENVAGFFTLRAHSVRIDENYFDRPLIEQNEDDYGPVYNSLIEVPLVELMYVARDLHWKRHGVGDLLMIEALKMVAQAADRIGLIGLHLRSTSHGIPLYERFDFRPFKEHPLFDGARYILPIQDVRKIAALS